MFCAKCGTSNADGAAFCKKCGNPLAKAPGATEQPAVQPVAQPTAQPAVQPVAQAAPAAQMAMGQPPIQQGQPGAYPPAGAAPMPYVPKPEGVLGAAWKDITSTPGWAKKVLILCLIGLIPILNFAVIGYALRWARELSFGQRAPMPEEIFRKKEISTGFFAELVRFALDSVAVMAALLVALVIGALIGFINPIAGFVVGVIMASLVALAAYIFWEPAVRAAIMRMTVVGYLESGFNIRKVFAAFKRAMGSLIGASLLPDIIVGAIQGLLVSILYGIMLGIIYAGASGMGGMRYGYSATNVATMVAGLGLGFILLATITMIVVSMLSTFAMLFSYRAVGHWAARNALDWADEADDKTVDSAEKVTVRGDVGPKANNGGAGAVMAAAPAAVAFGAQVANQVAPAPVQAAPAAIAPGDEGTMVIQDGSGLGVQAAPAQAGALPKGVTLIRKGNGKEYAITAFPATIGKGSAANVRIEDNDSISRVHARIKFTGSSYMVEDLGATNKTFLNGEELKEGQSTMLKDGDELGLASEVFTVKLA